MGFGVHVVARVAHDEVHADTRELLLKHAGHRGHGEWGVIQAGTGVQTTTNSRWGDYTSMNIDPSDDCTFWYVNEYYTAAGQASSPVGWQTGSQA